MTTDLWMLLAAALLQWLLIMAVAGPNLISNGLSWGMGNRDTSGGEWPEWQKRLQRANANLQENLPLFAIVVLVVQVAGKANGTTALGAQIFVGARVAHAVVYAAGVPVLRTLLWTVGMVGLVMMVTALF